MRSLTSTRDRNRLNLSSSLKISPMVLEDNLRLQEKTSILESVAVGAVRNSLDITKSVGCEIVGCDLTSMLFFEDSI